MALIDDVSTGELVSPGRLAQALHANKGELAAMTGLSRDAVSKTARIRQRSTQARMREVPRS